MKPQRLCYPSGTPSDVWQCTACGRLYGKCNRHDPEESATSCCADKVCTRCPAVIPAASVYTACQTCRDALSRTEEAEREAALFGKAVKLTAAECDEPVWHGDTFYRDLEEFLDHWADEPDEVRPEYLWCSKEIPFRPSAEDMVENALDDHHEDAQDQITGKEMMELTDFVEAWASRTGVQSFCPDYSRCVILPRVEGD